MRALLVTAAVSLASLTSCAPRHDVFLAWTIDGFPAAQACAQLTDPKVRVVVESRDVLGGAVTEETATFACVDGTPVDNEAKAVISTGNVADIVIEILDGEAVYGASDSVAVNPGAGGHYPGHDAEEAIASDVQLERGRLRATLRVVGQTCGDAGADSFEVTLRRKSSPLGTEVVETGTVACPGDGDDAVFEYQPVEFGDRYDVIATTSIGAVEYATNDGGAGEGVEIENGLTDLVVDLDVVARPD